jgi:hypothetical protein
MIYELIPFTRTVNEDKLPGTSFSGFISLTLFIFFLAHVRMANGLAQRKCAMVSHGYSLIAFASENVFEIIKSGGK